MDLVKHSRRVRDCPRCGQPKIWFHDRHNRYAGGKQITCDNEACGSIHGQEWGILCYNDEAATERHVCRSNKIRAQQQEQQDQERRAQQGQAWQETLKARREAQRVAEEEAVRPVDPTQPVDPTSPDPLIPAAAESVSAESVSADGMAALAGLLRPYMGPGLTQDQVDTMVAHAWAQQALPTRVEVVRNEEVRELPRTVHHAVPRLVKILAAGENVLMVGPAGSGKSTIASDCAEALGMTFYEISLSPQTPASDFRGFINATGGVVRTVFRDWCENGGLFHWDEFDNAHPSIITGINAALAQRRLAFPDKMLELHPDCLTMASANTYGKGGTAMHSARQKLDEASLDRFAIETIDYDQALEDTICAATGYDAWQAVVKVVRGLRANALEHSLQVVMSPRASLGLCRQLAQGVHWDEAVANRLRRGLSNDVWSKLTDGVAVAL